MWSSWYITGCKYDDVLIRNNFLVPVLQLINTANKTNNCPEDVTGRFMSHLDNHIRTPICETAAVQVHTQVTKLSPNKANFSL